MYEGDIADDPELEGKLSFISDDAVRRTLIEKLRQTKEEALEMLEKGKEIPVAQRQADLKLAVIDALNGTPGADWLEQVSAFIEREVCTPVSILMDYEVKNHHK
jgi:hypothetical protein